MIIESYSPEETKALGKKIGEEAKPGSIYCLSGDLGVGKTVFTKGFAQGLGVTDKYITSPTFTIINEYQGRLSLYHFDVYRINCIEEMDDTGYEDYFFGNGVCLVEWAELVKEIIPQEAVWITVEKNLEKGDDYRKITINNEE
ncbi:MAG TPA: tRNA (adenosine(37)-N6)-threonylcarbamoyltransferase complex ATPase subunit type 1 TsaE [Lachnospiraceae bacterium]|nr:tRNA (adenosine(37)-N6)-threonylcarbamoyltransferase complex ATPase subunit type 1 TsaE [Lachnospiraceae bacterium]